MSPSLDVAIVGGGPAGLATAINLKQYEKRVAVFDRQTPPIDKPCGEGLMPKGVEELQKLGINPQDSWARPFRGVRYIDGDTELQGSFLAGSGRGVRRTALHRRLLERARQTDVDLHWGTSVEGIRDHELETSNGSTRSHWIVGADGLHSRVRRWCNLEETNHRSDRFGFVRHYFREPWSEYVEVYWDPEYEAYVTPLGDEEIGVALLAEDQDPPFDRALESFPRLSEKLTGADESTHEQGWGPLYQTVSGVRAEHVFLVGDAAGYRDAITGEGLSIAFKQARVLAEALAKNQPEQYESTFRSVVRIPNSIIESLLWLRQYPHLRRRLMKVISGESQVFSFLLTVNDRGIRDSLREAIL